MAGKKTTKKKTQQSHEAMGTTTTIPTTVEVQQPTKEETLDVTTEAPRENLGPVSTETPQKEVTPQEVATVRSTIIQRCMSIPSFRKRVISRVVKNLS